MASLSGHTTTVKKAALGLRNGAVIAYPSEGVWGLGCDPGNGEAVSRILSLKGRVPEKGLILIADRLDRFTPFLGQVPALPETDLHSPTAITWVVNHGGAAPHWLRGDRATLAIRITNHPIARELCRSAEMALVSTSANPSGASSALSAEQVVAYFGDSIDMVVPGELGGQKGASEIRDLASGRVLRAREA